MEGNAETYILGVQVLVDLAMGIIIYRLQTATESRNRADDKRDKVISDLKNEVHTSAKALIDAEFRAVKHSVANHAQQLTSQMDKLAMNFAERDEAYTKMFERNPHAELKLVEALTDLKDEVRDSTCSRKDFDDLRSEHREMKAKLDQMATLGDLRKLLQEARNG